MSTVADFVLEPGAVLAGKYRVERIIGQGGMGIVAAGHHIQLEQRMALKLMLPHAMMSGEAVSRFVREARAAARISSEHVARVFDVGALDTGEPYIAMEYLEGSDIAQLLTSQGRLSVEQAIEYLLQACEALAEAHAAGIVHRDLKPGNLFLVQRLDGQRLVKVLDFGISKMSGASAQSNAPATRTSALMGSPLYMSPEQMGSSKAVDARSDVWALGVVLYEMLSGAPPFNGETLPQVCGMVMNEPPPPLVACAPGLPPLLYQVVDRCLEKQPPMRYQSVAELAQALEPLASLRGRQSVERILRVQGFVRTDQPTAPPSITGPVAQATTGPQQGTYAPWGETKPPVAPRRNSAPFVAVAAVALGLAGAGWWFVLRPAATITQQQLASAATAAAPPAAAAPPQATAAATVDTAAPAPVAASATPSASSAVAAGAPLPGKTSSRPVAAGSRPLKPPAGSAAATGVAGSAPAAAAAPAPAAPPADPKTATPPSVSTRSRF